MSISRRQFLRPWVRTWHAHNKFLREWQRSKFTHDRRTALVHLGALIDLTAERFDVDETARILRGAFRRLREAGLVAR